MKVLLILLDGLRPEILLREGAPRELLSRSAYTLKAKAVYPSVTLPSHMSLFHSVDPSRHGVTTNLYTPQVRPVRGLCEALSQAGKRCAFFYDWEELRDLSRPGSLAESHFINGDKIGYIESAKMLTAECANYLERAEADFTFLYYCAPDAAGHNYGWMGDEYVNASEFCLEKVKEVLGTLPDDYTVIITSDHGGHDRMHGSDCEEDMTIPILVLGGDGAARELPEGLTIMDIAPTVTSLLGVPADGEWEGKSFL